MPLLIVLLAITIMVVAGVFYMYSPWGKELMGTVKDEPLLIEGKNLQGKTSTSVVNEGTSTSVTKDEIEEARRRALDLSAIYREMSKQVRKAPRRDGEGPREGLSREYRQEKVLIAMANFLSPENTNPSTFISDDLRLGYISLVKDAQEMRAALPFEVSLRYPTPSLLTHVEENVVATGFKPHNCFAPEIFDPWIKRLGELLKLTKEFQLAVNERYKLKGDELYARGFNYQGLSSINGFPVISEENLSPQEAKVLREIRGSLDSMPLIERERAKRALSTISEAQQLQRKIENNTLTIEGKSPDEVVQEIVSRSIGQLDAVAKDKGERSPEDALEVLSIYSRSTEGR